MSCVTFSLSQSDRYPLLFFSLSLSMINYHPLCGREMMLLAKKNSNVRDNNARWGLD
jgi:hypothetical protein